jgi:bifunctional non-homologous end joining protein LigD
MARGTASLAKYKSKRDFSITPEPAEGGRSRKGALQFVIQKHWATRLHYDFRLELDGTMKSWAVPKGPSFDPVDKRMAVHVEDHPISYNQFEGEIPKGQYGGGKVIIWDRGVWTPLEDPQAGYRKGQLKFTMQGHKMRGAWALIRIRSREKKQNVWLLIKEKDEFVRPSSEFSVVDEMPDSVADRKSPKAGPMAKTKAKTKAKAKAKAKSPGRTPKSTLPAGLEVSHPDRVVDSASGLTKIQVVRYYGLVANLMMPLLKGRPVSLVKAPQGIAKPMFFQKHLENMRLEGVEPLDRKLSPGDPPFLEIAKPHGLLFAAQMNTIEFHTWNSTKDAIDEPDRIVFDLDPGKGIGWPSMQQAAELMHGFLEKLGLNAFLKTSGGKGLHVVVPVKPEYDWDTVKSFSQAVVVHMAETLPQLFVAKSGPKNRVNRIFIDYLRNGRGATTVEAWSVRARPGLGISVPVEWSELAKLKSSDQWTVANAHTRLAVGNAPWKSYARSAKSLKTAMKRLGFEPSGAR